MRTDLPCCKKCGVEFLRLGHYQNGKLVAIQYVHPKTVCRPTKRAPDEKPAGASFISKLFADFRR